MRRMRVGSARRTVRRWPSTVDAVAGLGQPAEQVEDQAAGGLGVGLGDVHAAGLGQDVERAGGVDLEDAVAQRGDLGRLAVELVLDRADQLLEDVLQAHHADDAAVLVEQHRQVDPVALEFDQELVEPERLGQERHLAGQLAEVGPAVARRRRRGRGP